MFRLPILVLGCLFLQICLRPVAGVGTTENIQEIFLGRCWEYQRIIDPEPFTEENGGLRDCDDLWVLFSEAFSYKDGCNVTIDSYTPFSEASFTDLPDDMTMFWSGVFQTVEDYNDVVPQYTVVADTLLGYLVNNMEWCGQVEDPGIDYDECTAYGACELGSSISYWRSVSIKFAQHAKGFVRVMLNGTNGHAYRDTSVFAQYELPNMSGNVTDVHVLLVHAYGQTIQEVCSNGTLAELKTIVEGKGFRYNCTDNPADIRYLLCTNDVNAYDCQMISEILGYTSGVRQVAPTALAIATLLSMWLCSFLI